MAQEAFRFTTEQEGGDNQDIQAEEVPRAALGQEQENNMQVLDAVTLEPRLEAREEIWLNAEGRREEACVAAGQFVQGEEGEVQQRTHREDHGEELQAEVQLVLWQVVPEQGMWPGEEVFADLQLGAQEEVVSEELRLEEQAAGVLGRSDGQDPGRLEERLIAGEQFVQDGEGEGTMEAVELWGDVEPQSEAEAKPQEGKPVQQEQAQSEPAGKCTWSPLAVLQDLQLQMEPLNERASRACTALRRRTWRRLKPYLAQRSLNIQRIPGFWATAVSFLSLPKNTFYVYI